MILSEVHGLNLNMWLHIDVVKQADFTCNLTVNLS